MTQIGLTKSIPRGCLLAVQPADLGSRKDLRPLPSSPTKRNRNQLVIADCLHCSPDIFRNLSSLEGKFHQMSHVLFEGLHRLRIDSWRSWRSWRSVRRGESNMEQQLHSIAPRATHLMYIAASCLQPWPGKARGSRGSTTH